MADFVDIFSDDGGLGDGVGAPAGGVAIAPAVPAAVFGDISSDDDGPGDGAGVPAGIVAIAPAVLAVVPPPPLAPDAGEQPAKKSKYGRGRHGTEVERRALSLAMVAARQRKRREAHSAKQAHVLKEWIDSEGFFLA